MRFNYIITIHNKENLIKDVLLSVVKAAGKNAYIFPVLDGCTDNSEAVIDEIITSRPDVKITKLYADDVHELRSINIGLKAASQENNSYNIILQDDVIINEPGIEDKIIKLYTQIPDLGIVSFRHGGNFSRSLLKKNKAVFPMRNYIETVFGHNPNAANMLQSGYFTYREIAIKSPVCIPASVINKIGIPDEAFAPWDDLAYCYSAIKAGFNNGIYAVDFLSDESWGTTRKKKQKISLSDVEAKNIILLKKLYGHEFAKFKQRAVFNNKKYKIFDADSLNAKSNYLVGLTKHYINKIKYFLKVLFN